MNDQWTDRLSEYVDGELALGERTVLDAHLATCTACRTTVEQLRRVVARARGLEDTPPAADLWRGIAQRIGVTAGGVTPIASRWQRRFTFSMPQLAAASIALAVVSGGGVFLALRHRPVEPPAGSPLARSGVMQPASYNGGWRIRTDAAIAELQETLDLNEAKLDTATVRVVRQNLAIIDRAIAQAQRALRRDPGNTYLNLHLANTMRQKIELLRRANALASSGT